MFGKNQTRWYIYTWVLFSTHVWILTHMYGKRHTCVKKATQLYDCKCLAFSTHVWEKPPTCLFPPELSVTGPHQSSNAMFYLQLQKDIKIYFNQYLTAHNDALSVRKLGILDSDVPEVDLILTLTNTVKCNYDDT